MPPGPVELNRRFGGVYCIRLCTRRERKWQQSKFCLPLAFFGFLRDLFVSSEDIKICYSERSVNRTIRHYN
jgi:hypothetical protein